jgi:hypothetical protein
MASSQQTVDQFEALLSRMKSHAKGEDLIGVLLGEISGALADILAQMEKPEAPDDYGAMGAAFGAAMRAALSEAKAPVVNFTSPPAVISLQERDHPAPSVTVNPTISSPSGTQHRVQIEKDFNGRTTGFIITKL